MVAERFGAVGAAHRDPFVLVAFERVELGERRTDERAAPPVHDVAPGPKTAPG